MGTQSGGSKMAHGTAVFVDARLLVLKDVVHADYVAFHARNLLYTYKASTAIAHALKLHDHM